MKGKQENHIIDVLFVIALFCIFALSAIFLISIGADIYRKTVTHMESNFNSRTTFAYVTEKVRQSDISGAVTVGELDDLPALLLTEKQGDTEYITYLYEHEGFLKELMVRKDTPLGPSAGQEIVEITEFNLEQISDRLFSFSITTNNGESCNLYVSIKTEGGTGHE